MESNNQTKPNRAIIINNAINYMLKMFKSGNFPQSVSMSIIRKHEGDYIPSDSWSLGNRIFMRSQGTNDARGFRQWQQVNRKVKKGTKAIHIFSPIMKKITETDQKTGEELQKTIIIGFSPLPVFRYEDTEGDPLKKYDYAPRTYPPFFDVAEKLGIEVTYKPLRSNYYGLYNSISDNITLCSDSAITYYHELAHALDNRLNPDFYKLGKERKEIVAEFAGIILCQLSGISGYEDQSYKYIREYCKNDKTDAAILKSIMGVLADVEKIVEEVLSVSNDFERVDNDAEDSNLIFGA